MLSSLHARQSGDRWICITCLIQAYWHNSQYTYPGLKEAVVGEIILNTDLVDNPLPWFRLRRFLALPSAYEDSNCWLKDCLGRINTPLPNFLCDMIYGDSGNSRQWLDDGYKPATNTSTLHHSYKLLARRFFINSSLIKHGDQEYVGSE